MISRFLRWARGLLRIRGKQAARPLALVPKDPILHFSVGYRPLCDRIPGPAAWCTVEADRVTCPGCKQRMRIVGLRRAISVR